LTGTDTALYSYDDRAFEQLFKAHFKALHAYAHTFLRDEEMAEEIVQNLFMKLWQKRELLQAHTSVKAYLYKCVHNDCLNHIKHLKIQGKYQEHALYTMDQHTEAASHRVELSELENRLGQALKELPEQCRAIFQMSRFEELKYKEIAEELGISIKTVENQMGKALRLLRLKLADFLLVLIALLLYWKDFFNG
jgi:RNA polymerase sigma-70 factor (ECF subfamily)